MWMAVGSTALAAPPEDSPPADTETAAPLEQARAATGEKKYDEAIGLYDRFLSAHPDADDARVERARVLAWAGRTKEAAGAFEDARRRHPDDDALLLEEGKVLSWSRDPSEVRTGAGLLREYLARRPNDDEARLALARASSWSGDDATAEAELRTYLTRHPGDTAVLREAAVGLAVGRTPARALPFFEAYLRAHPGDVEAKLAFAKALTWSNELTRARHVLLELRETAPGPGVDLEYARVLSQTGRRWEAFEIADAIVAAHPENGEARRLRDELALDFASYVRETAQAFKDSTDVTMFWTRTTGYVAVTRAFGGIVDVTPYSLTSSRETLWALQANAGARLRPSRVIELEAAAGPRFYQYYAPHYGGRAQAKLSLFPEASATVDYVYDDAYAILYQPASVAARIWIHSVALTPEVAVGRLSATVRGGLRVASPTNAGAEASGTLAVRVLGPLRVGYATQWLEWSYNDPAYWSPQGYASHLGIVRAADTLLGGRLGYDGQVGLGIAGERIEHLPQSDYGIAYTASGAVLWMPLDKLRFKVSGAYSRTVRELVTLVATGTSGQPQRIKEGSTYSFGTALVEGTLVF
jgi:hypothetical protein